MIATVTGFYWKEIVIFWSEQDQLGKRTGIFYIHIFFPQNAYIFTWRKKDLMHKMLNCIYIRMDVCMFYQF